MGGGGDSSCSSRSIHGPMTRREYPTNSFRRQGDCFVVSAVASRPRAPTGCTGSISSAPREEPDPTDPCFEVLPTLNRDDTLRGTSTSYLVAGHAEPDPQTHSPVQLPLAFAPGRPMTIELPTLADADASDARLHILRKRTISSGDVSTVFNERHLGTADKVDTRTRPGYRGGPPVELREAIWPLDVNDLDGRTAVTLQNHSSEDLTVYGLEVHTH